MSRTAAQFVARALAEWIGADLSSHFDFAREGLPDCDTEHLLGLLAANPAIVASNFSVALVGFSTPFEKLQKTLAARSFPALTDDLHEATDWRNRRKEHPRIIALATGYNPSVHGLDFFARSSSSELATHLLQWAQGQDQFKAAPIHSQLLAVLQSATSLKGLRSLDSIARFLDAWGKAADAFEAPLLALPMLGLLPDPALFEAKDPAKRLARNLAVRSLITILAPGEIRQRRQRAERYTSVELRETILQTLDALDLFRQNAVDHGLTLEAAERVVRLPKDEDEPEDAPENDDRTIEDPDVFDDDSGSGTIDGLDGIEVDALLGGREEDLEAIGKAIDQAWDNFEQNNSRIVGSAETSVGPVAFDLSVNDQALQWATEFCSADRFGGLIETEVLDLKQALERYSEGEPVLLEAASAWSHEGRTFSLEQLFDGWDKLIVPDGNRPLAVIWREFQDRRRVLADCIRPLLVHPREFLDTHPDQRVTCEEYLDHASELYSGVQLRYPVVADQSPEWAQATLDVLLSLDLLQVRIRQESDVVSAKAVMLPLHPLHLWRYSRMSEMLRNFARDKNLKPEDRAALIAELHRPEQFLSVVRAGQAPHKRGLDQVLPVANHIEGLGLATFENLHNAISSADGIDTLIRGIEHFALLYPNHVRPMRIALVNPPEPTRIVERVVKLLEDRAGSESALGRIEIDMFVTDLHQDRLAAAAVLEGGAQDLIYEKVAAERLEIRVADAPSGALNELISTAFGQRRYHLISVFDESTITIRKRTVESVLNMSPFCIRNEIRSDGLLGNIWLSPHPGQRPFSDFVLMMQARQGERLDTAMYAAADAEDLRVLTDRLVTGPDPIARWMMLADRALPREAGMQSVRLLERPDGKRKVLLAAGDYDRLADAMEVAFAHCNLPVGRRELAEVLRQGAHLVGGGLLDLIRKQSGEADNSNVLGFVGMLLAARDARRRHSDCIIASVDTRIARLWLRLKIGGGAMNRCDLLSLRRTEEGIFIFTTYEVKTTLEVEPAEEKQRIDAALEQAVSTSAVIRSAFQDEDLFSAPRLEMLKEVLVRAASIRWKDEEADADDRRRWGPWLRDLFNADEQPPVRVETEVVMVKLRANRAPQRSVLQGDGTPATLSVITEPLARVLLGIDKGSADLAGGSDSVRNHEHHDQGLTETTNRPEPINANVANGTEVPTETASSENAAQPAQGWDARARVLLNIADEQDELSLRTRSVQIAAVDKSAPEPTIAALGTTDGSWPPPLNDLGMIGQHEAARELADLALKCADWDERFPDKLLVGPAGVGKTSLAYEVATRFLKLKPIIFNGADLRRPEMIVERLIKDGKVPEDALSSTEAIVVNPCVLFIDEVHAIAPSVATALLSALDERRTTTVGNTVFSFEDVVFLLATTDPGKLTEAFLSRPTRTALRPYTLEETAGIVWLRAKGQLDNADLARETCIEIAARMQCSPRPSVQILTPLIAYFYRRLKTEAGGNSIPSRAAVAERMTPGAVAAWFAETQKVDANGIGPNHRNFLALLSKRGAAPEDEIRRSLSISNRNDFIELESYLKRLGLIQVGAGGRILTREGRRYVVEGDRMDLRDRIPIRAEG